MRNGAKPLQHRPPGSHEIQRQTTPGRIRYPWGDSLPSIPVQDNGNRVEAAEPAAVEPGPPPAAKRDRPVYRIKPLYQRWWAWALLTTVAGVSGVTVATLDTLKRIEKNLPASERALTFVRDGTLTIRAADNSVLQQLGPATRAKLTFSQIPPQLVQAFVASEDRKFYEHAGVDYQAIARAIRANILAGDVVEGASTITQQLARIVFLGQEQTLDRKVREAMMAQKMERELSKDQILERYLNLVYLGSGAYGVADAAWVYFSKTVDQLTLSEMALIAGLAPAPSSFSPLVDLDAALIRRDVVLERMVEAGYLTSAEMEQVKAEPITLKPSIPRMLYSEVPYFTSYVQQQLPKLIPAEELEAGGLTVETTLKPEWQKLAQETVTNAIRRYGRGQRFSAAALVAIDPRTGEIRALVGGDDFNESQFNRATQAMRQPGSTFKSFVYATAIASGLSPHKTYLDSKLVVDGYEPQNFNRKHSGNLSMRDALIKSVNVVAVKALIEVGFQPVIDVATRMGINSKLLPTYSLSLGSSEVTLLELTGAYGTFAAEGKHIEPHGIRRVTNRFGKVIYEAKFEPEQAIDEDTANIMTWMLRGVVTEGTGRNAALPNRSVAGKTGTSENKRDLWFVGYIPQMVTGVWLGNDNNRPTRGASSTAALVWRNFMREVTQDMEVESFPRLPRLSGRERTVTRQPVKPRRMVVGAAPRRDEAEERSEERSSESREERRRRRRARSQEAAVAEPETEQTSTSEETAEPQPTERRRRRRREAAREAAPAPAERAPRAQEAAPEPPPAADPAPAPAAESRPEPAPAPAAPDPAPAPEPEPATP